MEAKLMKMKDVAEMLGVSLSYAYLLTKRGELPTVRIGNAIRVRVGDLEQYLKGKVVQNESPYTFPYSKK